MRRLLAASCIFAGAVLGACDPCTGISDCNTSPHVSVSGQILNDTTGLPESGATIDFVRTAGALLERDSARTFTDADGLFTIDIETRDTGDVVADIVVRPRRGPGYRARGQRIPTSNRGGEARVLGPWSSVPHLADFGEIYRRGGANEVLPNVQIEFRRTGGVSLRDLPSGVYRATTSATGLVPLFGDRVRPLDAGEVVGDLTIFLSDPPGPSVHRDYRIISAPDFRYYARIHRLGAGPSLRYFLYVYERGRPGMHAADVRIEFQRRAGIEIDPPTWAITTPGTGPIIFSARALAYGVVTGDLTITPPTPWKSYTRSGWQFATFDGDSTPTAGIFGVGPGLPYYVIIRANGKPLEGARVDFRRTGGINVTPSTFGAVTSDSGIVYLTPEPEGEGEVVADITVTPPAPFAKFVVRNLRLIARDDDVPGGRVLLGDWDVTQPPLQSGSP